MFHIIINPVAGKGSAEAALPAIEGFLKEKNISYGLRRTQWIGHATSLAREAVRESSEGVISMGGDGTIREIAEGLHGTDVPLLILPCGTGNDLAKSLRLPKKALPALQKQLSAPPSAMDAGHAGNHLFVNASGTGFDVDVLQNMLAYKERFKGLLPYLLGIFAAIRKYKPLEIEMRVGDAIIKKKITLISIANGQYIGGGMRVAPTAQVKDGHFDVYYVDAVPRFLILFLLPLFVNGWYRFLPISHVLYAETLTIRGADMTIQIDGDLIAQNEVAYRIMPNELKIRA